MAGDMARSAHRIALAVTSDPALGRDEVRLAALIREELDTGAKLSRIPACLRDDRDGGAGSAARQFSAEPLRTDDEFTRRCPSDDGT
jgi:hypothetical protein